MTKQNIFKLIFSLVICQLTGVVGSLFTAPAIPNWYASLVKPMFNPPSWLFGPVWVILYFLMGLALYLIWINKHPQSRMAVNFFILHLAFNALWSALFFGLQSPYLALLGIIILYLMIIMLVVWFARISKAASYLLVPYLLWVSFAILLNYYLWQLN